MSLLPLSQLTPYINDIRLIVSDVDGTLTRHEHFTPALLTAIAQLKACNIPVLLATGRSAGWADALRYYLPVAGAIAENGGLFWSNAPTHAEASYQLLSPISDAITHRQALAEAFAKLRQQYPNLREATDNAFRVTDWTFSVQGLSAEELAAIASQCAAWGWGFTYSNVQCHIGPLGQNKAHGIWQAIQQDFPHLQPHQVLTIGDSPNDVAMLNP
ncbi:MAG TPA: HAD family hydrolase, partial [Stenomitos sp.]